jgi:hypothetical protein
LSVTHPENLSVGVPTDFTVTVRREETAVPVAGAVVAICKRAGDALEIYETGRTDSEGRAVFEDLSPPSPGAMKVTVTDYNALPYQGAVAIGGLEVVCDFRDQPGGIVLEWGPGPFERTDIYRRTDESVGWGDPLVSLGGNPRRWEDDTGLHRWQEYRVIGYLMPPAGTVEGFCTVDLTGAEIFLRADANSDGKVDLSDAVTIFRYLFSGGGHNPEACLDACDSNDDEDVDIADGIYILIYQFGGGRPPPRPFPHCGRDGPQAVSNQLDCPGYPLGSCPLD